MKSVSIAGLNKAFVLVALYDHAKCRGMGHLQYKPGGLDLKEAESLLKKCDYFDYLYGRVMKVSLGEDKIETTLYDRDNGEGAAENALRQFGLIQ